MPKALNTILEVQELDMKMIRLMRLKRDRQKELESIRAVEAGLAQQAREKHENILTLKMGIKQGEADIADTVAKIKKLEAQQNQVKKVDEFNALTQETAAADRERANREQQLSELYDKLAAEEDSFKSLNETLATTSENSKAVEAEIQDSIVKINAEGRVLKKERDQIAVKADPEVLNVYERLLRNKKDRVVVPIENRCCSGCHIMLTAQDENLVRKGERLVFCEHCSRIHYWQESEAMEGTATAAKPRRRRATKAS